MALRMPGFLHYANWNRATLVTLCRKLGLREDPSVNGFSIYEIYNGVGRPLRDAEKLCDVLSKFETLSKSFTKTKLKLELQFRKHLALVCCHLLIYRIQSETMSMLLSDDWCSTKL